MAWKKNTPGNINEPVIPVKKPLDENTTDLIRGLLILSAKNPFPDRAKRL